MRALVVSHDPSEEPAAVGDHLRQLAVELDVFVVCDAPDDPVSHRPFPALDGYDFVVAMGAPWSVYDTDTIGTWIDRELAWLRAAHDDGVPILGICFGAQALAAALGGSVERAPRGELGWIEVRSDFPDEIAPGPWFAWHRDRFSVPPGGVELARNDVGPQAFRTEHSLAVQFHPEVDQRLLHAWLGDGDASDSLFGRLGTTPAALLARTAALERVSVPNARRLVDHFLQEVMRCPTT
jgi:GMP synthase-like glutamine amidotransferase